MKTKFICAVAASLLALACIAKTRLETQKTSATPAYRLHEWGTFTSVSGSDGRLLEGVERDVEPLPFFVHAHEWPSAPMPVFSKGLGNRPLKGVTVKMETPVIYFYTDQPFDAEVSVGFKGGSISQWFPSRSGGETVPFHGTDPATMKYSDGMMDFHTPFEGSIKWKVSVKPASADWPARVYHPQETPVWMYPRLPASALVRTPDGETEKYLFYRGVGRFDMPVSAAFTHDRTVLLSNAGAEVIPALMTYELTKQGTVRWQVIPALANGAVNEIHLDEFKEVPSAEARLAVHQAMAGMLMDAGLNRAEADAMILTWQASYFATEGLRLFWVAPRSFTDRILPLHVTPPPTSCERVILGRLEMLSPSWERELLARANEVDKAVPKQAHPFSYMRHWPAYEQRLQQLRSSSAQNSASVNLKLPTNEDRPATNKIAKTTDSR